MSSFLNKISNSISSNASMVLGREAASKLTNALNNVIYNAKYKELLKSGNIIQLVSKNAHMSLQICASPNDNNRLIVLGKLSFYFNILLYPISFFSLCLFKKVMGK